MKPTIELDRETRDTAVQFWNKLVSTVGLDDAVMKVIGIVQHESSSLSDDYIDTLKYILDLVNTSENISSQDLHKTTRKILSEVISSDYKTLIEDLLKENEVENQEEKGEEGPNIDEIARMLSAKPNPTFARYPECESPFSFCEEEAFTMVIKRKTEKEAEQPPADLPSWTTYHRNTLQLMLELARLLQPYQGKLPYEPITEEWDTISLLEYVELELSRVLSKQ